MIVSRNPSVRGEIECEKMVDEKKAKIVDEDEDEVSVDDEDEPVVQVKQPKAPKPGKAPKGEEDEEEDEEGEEAEFHDPSTVYPEGTVTQKVFINRAVERIKTLDPELTKGMAKRITREVIQTIADSVYSLGNKEKVSLKALGTFKAVDRVERKKRNPATGEPVDVKADRAFRFRAKFHVFPDLKQKGSE